MFWKVEVDLPLHLREDVLELIEQDLHDLALKDHVDRHVGRLDLRSEQRGSEHDGDALHRHSVRIFVLDDPERSREAGEDWF